jgi:hypothetical protein
MSFSEEEIDAQLERLEAQEREISAYRQKVFDRLATFPTPEAMEEEREISDERRELHKQIDALRAQRSAHRGEREAGNTQGA